jgi:FkbM family methyltransferase
VNRILIFLRYVYFTFVILIRNIRWAIILLFCRKERVWDVLGFKMYLSAEKAGLDFRGKSIHKQLILDGIRERKSTRIMEQFIRPDDVILELGANIGYYVLIESTVLSNKGYIYAVEPGLENIKLLEKNVTLNNIKNIEICNKAMSNEKGTAKLYMGKACNLHSLINSSNASDAKYVEVETDTVDNFIKGRKPITFLRMDVEGYETEVIDGMHDIFKSPHFERLFVEIHPHRVSSEKMQKFFTIVREYGFEIAYSVFRDTFERSVLGQSIVEKITINELMTDDRVTKHKVGFELFFERIKRP